MNNRPKRPPKTIKEKRWLKRTIELGNGAEAAREVYNCKNKHSARSIASQNFAKLAIDQALEAEGLTPFYSARMLKKGTKSKKIHGTSDDYIEVVDMPTRHKYLETMLRLQGHGPNRDMTINVDARTQYHVTLPERK